MKKTVCLLLMLVVVFAASACTQDVPPVTPGPPADKEYDADGNRYVDAAQKREGMQALYYRGIDAYLEKDKYGEFDDELPAIGKPWDEFLGFVHAGGQYNFTSLPYTEEGLGVINTDLKSKTMKNFLVPGMADQYSFNQNWEGGDGFAATNAGIADVAKSNYMRTLFRSPITTHILVTYEYKRVTWAKTTEIAQADLAYVQKEFYNLGKHLLTAYNGQGKTFILQNWEGDNELTPALKAISSGSALTPDKQKVIENYVAYSNARQAGIVQARDEVESDAKLYGALEINFISSNYGKQPKLVDHLENTTADLYSFSDWSTENVSLAADLAAFKQKAPDSEAFGDNNIYLGEYGRAEYRSGSSEPEAQFSSSIETMKIAAAAGAQYVCYWQTMCNERAGGMTSRPVDADMKGYWLIRPGGSFTKNFWYFKGLLENKNYLASMPKLVMRLPEAEPDPIALAEEDVIFNDTFDDINLDGEPDISRNRKLSGYSDNMRYDNTREADRPFFNKYITKYGIEPDVAYTTVQKKEGNAEDGYIEYEIKRASGQRTAKFAVQGFLYDLTPKTIIKIAAGETQEAFEDVTTAYLVDKTGDYGYLYISAELPEKYKYVRVMFTNKGQNSWNPLMCRAVFMK